MPLFSRTPDFRTQFSKNEVVRATVDLPGVPSGSLGKVKMINGFDWVRYWVFFDNGVDMGQLDANDLVRPEHWVQFFEEKQAAEQAAAAAAEAANSAADSAGGAGATDTAADGDDPLAKLRALIPPHLIERSKAARERLGA